MSNISLEILAKGKIPTFTLTMDTGHLITYRGVISKDFLKISAMDETEFSCL